MKDATISEALAGLRQGRLSASVLAEQALERAAARRELNAMAHLDEDAVRAQAARLDEETREGRSRGPLHGVPLTVKDLFVVDGMPTRCGARATMPLGPGETVAVRRLRAAGALILGKTNMVEIALGTTGENPWTGDVKNPHDPSRMSGGSSSGSAVAVAAGIGLGSLGSDTAGSIRIPAAWCGVVGFKPTHGVVPLEGALGLCPSCDHAGPLARSVADAALLFAVLASRPVPEVSPDSSRPPRMAVPRRHLEGALGGEVQAAFEALLERLRAAGAVLVDACPEHLERAGEAFLPLRAESAAIHRVALAREPGSFSPFVRAELERGAAISDEEHREGLRLRALVREGLVASLAGVDALLWPSVPVTAPPRGATETLLAGGRVPLRQAVLHLSRPSALAGLPAVSVPFARLSGLPVGADVASAPGTDERALRVAAWVEAVAGRPGNP